MTKNADDPARALLDRMRDRPQQDRDLVAELLERAAESLERSLPRPH